MEKLKLNDLVTRARAGDAEAMNELINVSYQDMYYYALKIVKKDHLAADVTQDSCIEIIRNLSGLKESAAFITWCRRIVYNQCTKRTGKSRVVALEENEEGETILDRIPDETPGTLPEEIMENRELRETILHMIDELPEAQRSALMLYYYERLSVKQIAVIQDENENTVKSRLFQGRKAVKKQIEAYEEKTGTKLYSISILPLFYFLFHTGRAEADAAAAAHLPQIQTAIAPAVASCTAGAAAASSVAVKIVAGVLAVSLAAGGIAAGSYLSNQPSEDGEPSTRHTKASTTAEHEEHEEHIHIFEEWDFDEDTHWQICECGALSERSEHTFADGECTVCYELESDYREETFDCTVLSGKWINVMAQDPDVPVPELYVDEDGNFVIRGTVYRPHAFIDEEFGQPHFNLFEYSPMQEGNKARFWGFLNENGGIYTLCMREYDGAGGLGELYYYYREEDYSGYEKVALTLENYKQYITVDFSPKEITYDPYNDAVRVYQFMEVKLRTDLGQPSWCKLEGILHRESLIVEYDMNSNRGTTSSPPNPERTEEPLIIDFIENYYSEDIGTFWPVNESGKYTYGNPKGVTVEKIMGYVFVPIE